MNSFACLTIAETNKKTVIPCTEKYIRINKQWLHEFLSRRRFYWHFCALSIPSDPMFYCIGKHDKDFYFAMSPIRIDNRNFFSRLWENCSIDATRVYSYKFREFRWSEKNAIQIAWIWRPVLLAFIACFNKMSKYSANKKIIGTQKKRTIDEKYRHTANILCTHKKVNKQTLFE